MILLYQLLREKESFRICEFLDPKNCPSYTKNMTIVHCKLICWILNFKARFDYMTSLRLSDRRDKLSRIHIQIVTHTTLSSSLTRILLSNNKYKIKELCNFRCFHTLMYLECSNVLYY